MDNRMQFRELIARHELKQYEAAALICAYTSRPCAVRTVRSWINDPEKPSSYPCPDWAVSALKDALRLRESGSAEELGGLEGMDQEGEV